MLVQCLIVTAAIIYLVMHWKNRHKRKMIEEMRNNLKCWPLFGHSFYFTGSDEDRMNSLREIGKETIRCGGSTCLSVLNKLIVSVANPDDTEFILKTCMEKDDCLKVTRALLGYGSIFAPVSIWRPRRKVLAPHFNLKRLWSFTDVHARRSQVLVDRLTTTVGAGVFSLWDYITAYTMESIGETILGTNLEAQKHDEHPFPKAFVKHSELQAARLLQPWLQNDFIYRWMPCSSVYNRLSNFMKNFVEQLIIEKRKILHEIKKDPDDNSYVMKGKRPKAMIESFIEAAELTDIEIHEETLVLVLAGTDTSAVGVSFAVSLLSRHQDVQEKLYRELQEYYGDSNKEVTADDLPQLKYLEAVTKETLRLYPPVPLIARKCEQYLTLPSGRTLVPGVGVYINIWAIHRHPQYWGPDAESFRPERFLGGEINHPAAYIPFSRGSRNCLGLQYASMSMKTALINLLRNYKFLAPPGDNRKDLNVKYDVMLKNVDNFQIQVEARK